MNTLEQSLCQIPNFSYIHERLFSSALPNAEQLHQIKEYGCNIIINIAPNDASPHLEHEDRLCLDLGLQYIQIPIDWEIPSAEQCLLVLDLIDHLVQEQIVWIHCAKNYRVSCLMYLYRQFYMDIDMPDAMKMLHQIWEPNETWTGLLHSVALQLQGRKATKELEQSLTESHHLTE